MSRAIVVTAGLVILGLAFGAVWMQAAKYEPVIVGNPAPDFALDDLEGHTRKLSDYRGKVVFLNFWATWCKPCQEEMPSMEQLHQNFQKAFKDDFIMLAVSIDKSPSEVKPFMEKYNLTFPALHDRWGKVDRTYKLMGVPETYIIDQNGILAEKIIGPRDWTRAQSIRGMLDLLEKGPTPSIAAQEATYKG